VARLRLLKFLFVVAVLALAAGCFVAYVPYGPATQTFVEIAPGTGTPRIAEQLKKAGIVRSSFAFEAMKAYKQGTLKAGEYKFDHPATLTEVYDRLRRGDVYTISLTIPEGYNIFDIADAVQRSGLLMGTPDARGAFLQAAFAHVELVRPWSPGAKSVEGYLFPDTYKFSRHATATEILATMVRRFTVEAARLGIVPSADAPDLVTMASLIEKEVNLDAERPVVASVFENRLAAAMPLQTDPAVVYASLLRGTWTGVIHQSELHSDSAYNTYAHAGLPPGPICNPGVAALKAALHPAHTDYLYFVATSGGATKFSRSLEEHNANVAAYRSAAR
jgi:UPF0755 protein